MGSDPRLGTRLAGFRIESLRGRGGMSVVYVAEQERPRRMVALKLLAPELAADAAFRERFERESEASAAIDHPNVVPVYATGEAGGTLYIAMRLVDGVDLGELIRQEGHLSIGRTLAIVEQIASALDASHALGLVHRDVKPGNVLVVPSSDTGGRDHAYLADFGLITRHDAVSGLTKTGQFMGSVDYVAPEQIRGEHVDDRTDVYSLGCLLYESLVGEPPFPRDNDASVLWAHLQEPVPSVTSHRDDVPTGLDHVVARAMAKDALARFSSCGELAIAARLASSTSGGTTVRTAEAVAERRPRQRRPALVVGLLAGVLAIGAVVALAVLLSGEDGGTSAHHATLAVQANTIVAIDPETSKLVQSIPVGEGPSILVQGSVAWTVNGAEGTVTWVDLDNAKTKTIVIDGLRPGLPSPKTWILPIVPEPDGKGGVWVYSQRSRTIAHVSGTTLESDRQITIPAKPNDIARLPDGSFWETTGYDRDNFVIEFDPRTGDELARIEVGQGALLAAYGFGSLWVVEFNSQTLDRISPTTAELAEQIPIASAPFGLAVDKEAVWVGALTGDKVFRIDPVSGNVVDQVPAGRAAGAMVAREGHLWVANQESRTISVIDTFRNQEIGTIKIDLVPTSLGFADDGLLWVAVASPGWESPPG